MDRAFAKPSKNRKITFLAFPRLGYVQSKSFSCEQNKYNRSEFEINQLLFHNCH